MMSALTDFLEQFEILGAAGPLVALGLAVFGVVILAMLANFITRKLIVTTLRQMVKKTASTRDDSLARRNVFQRLSHVAPALVIYFMAPMVLGEYPNISNAVVMLSLVYIAIVCVFFLDALINAGLEIYNTYPLSKTFPINSFVQVAKLLLYFLGLIAVLSLLLGKSPLTFLAGFGALTAVMMLVFKDPILGFVAGIQLSANRMVSVGDWIEMPRYGVDGDVLEIALTTVKIRNFDKTITTIPTQSLINDSFKNWRGMQETGGRRIKRSVYIDISSIRFCDEEMLQRFSKIQYIADYLDQKNQELQQFNSAEEVDTSALANGRRLTNVGTFRAYTEAYLRAHPQISKQLTLLVRQLQPTEYGLQIEIYVFTTVTDWLVYESIQADIFDHILAVAPEFDLRVFQNPTSGDFGQLAQTAIARQ